MHRVPSRFFLVHRLLRNLIYCKSNAKFTTFCPRNPIAIGKLNDHHYLPTLHECNKLLKLQCALNNLQQNRSKSKRSKAKSTETEEESESEGEDEEDDDEAFETDLDYDAPTTYKDVVISGGGRADGVASKGLNIPRHEIEQYFYSSDILLNGKTLLKKAKKLNSGDILDLVTSRTDTKLKVKRVKVLKRTDSADDKGSSYVMQVRTWRRPFEIDKP